MKKKIIIHIGYPKTATTTIQSFLSLNRIALSESGVFFAKSRRNENQTALSCYASPRNSNRMIKKLNSLQGNDFLVNYEEKIKETVSNALTDHDTIVFSNEHLSHKIRTKESVEKLYQLFESFDAEVKILIYLRRQDSYIISSYSTRIKNRRAEVFRLKLKKELFYDQLLDRWANVFGAKNIVPRVFDKEHLLNNNVLDDFAFNIGINSLEKFERPKSTNVSLDTNQLEFLRLSNRKIDRSNVKAGNFKRKILLEALAETSVGNKMKIKKQDLMEIKSFYKDSNQRLFSTYFNSKKDLFEIRIPEDYEEELPSLTVDQAVGIGYNLFSYSNRKSKKKKHRRSKGKNA